jgi:benzil reductase ((S)-benzoin forming)
MNYYFITGTSSGIGKALVNQLLLDENNFIYGYSRTNALENARFKHTVVDLSKLKKVCNITFPNLKKADKIILINNAGTLGEIKHLGNLNNKDIITSFNVNITAVTILVNSFIKQYQSKKNERIIINISSGAAKSAYDGWATYCSTKAAINMLTETIDKEQKLQHSPIKAFAIAPGVVDTYMQEFIRKTDEKDFSNIEKFHSLKTSGSLYKAKDVANKLISLCEDTTKIKGLISRIEL